MKAIMTEEVLPGLGKKKDGEWITVRTSGIFESALAARLEAVMASFPQLRVAFLPDYSGVDIRLGPDPVGKTARGEVESAARAIETELGLLAYGRDGASVEKIVLESLTARGETLALAESCTGGLLASLITDVPGASHVLLGSVVAYSNAVKEQQLGVSPESMREFGAVSEPVAREMAAGAQATLGGTWGVATTGIAGPTGGSSKKPVGLVYIAVAGPGGIVSKELRLVPIRLPHKAATAQAALNLLRREILHHE
jgi:nicotinamide-nucleotide amidase